MALENKEEITVVRAGSQPRIDPARRIYLLLLDDFHVALIKDLDMFLRCNKNVNIYKNVKYCRFCLQPVGKSVNHEAISGVQRKAVGRVILPAPDEKIKSKNISSREPPPFIAYADTESVLSPVNKSNSGLCQVQQMHELCAYNLIILETASNRIVHDRLKIVANPEELAMNFITGTVEASGRLIRE